MASTQLLIRKIYFPVQLFLKKYQFDMTQKKKRADVNMLKSPPIIIHYKNHEAQISEILKMF